jgi:hypothetical protein
VLTMPTRVSSARCISATHATRTATSLTVPGHIAAGTAGGATASPFCLEFRGGCGSRGAKEQSVSGRERTMCCDRRR